MIVSNWISFYKESTPDLMLTFDKFEVGVRTKERYMPRLGNLASPAAWWVDGSHDGYTRFMRIEWNFTRIQVATKGYKDITFKP